MMIKDFNKSPLKISVNSIFDDKIVELKLSPLNLMVKNLIFMKLAFNIIQKFQGIFMPVYFNNYNFKFLFLLSNL